MAYAVKFFPRLLLALSILFAGALPFKPVPVQAQSMLERLFGRPTLEHRRKIGKPATRRTVARQPVRKKAYRKKATRPSTKSRNAVRSASRSTRKRSSGSRKRSVSAGSSYTYRTLCVRKADGYFFPVSFSTTSDYFDRDLESCEARCPGADVDLYHHRVLREEAEQMVSHTTGDEYTSLATAFAYKTKGVNKAAAKACEIAPGPSPQEVIAASLGDLPFDSPIPLPVRRPDPDQVLFSELRGGDKEMAEVTGRPKVIRRVGPRFFPDQ